MIKLVDLIQAEPFLIIFFWQRQDVYKEKAQYILLRLWQSSLKLLKKTKTFWLPRLLNTTGFAKSVNLFSLDISISISRIYLLCSTLVVWDEAKKFLTQINKNPNINYIRLLISKFMPPYHLLQYDGVFGCDKDCRPRRG